MICTNIICGEKILIDIIGGGRVSVIGLFDGDINIPVFPFSAPMVFYSRFKRENNEAIPEIVLELKLNDDLLSEHPIKLNFNIPNQDCKTLTNIQSIDIKTPGNFSASIINKSDNGLVLKTTSVTFIKQIPNISATPYSK